MPVIAFQAVPEGLFGGKKSGRGGADAQWQGMQVNMQRVRAQWRG